MTVGRNEPCPCGSGQKYKSCCIGKERSTSRGLLYLMLAIAAVAAVGLGATIMGRKENTASTPSSPQGGTQAARPTTPQPQPPGPAPAGKVWSAEHGHWHDAAPGAQPTKENPITFNRRNVPQPPGPVPAGKVWSPEHGHWHNKRK